MSDERLRILKMLEEGKITAEEASQLLDALGSTDASQNAGPGVRPAIASRGKAKWLRIEVKERNGNQVYVRAPVALVRAALRLGGRFKWGAFDTKQLDSNVMEELAAALTEGEAGLLVDAVEQDGDRVKIFLE
ncbi:MAG: DUF2089 domain-containing protein [Chloroflexi bacterium]|nr:DUF2089 domain-containing protein [Chloroflexota bacterium]